MEIMTLLINFIKFSDKNIAGGLFSHNKSFYCVDTFHQYLILSIISFIIYDQLKNLNLLIVILV